MKKYTDAELNELAIRVYGSSGAEKKCLMAELFNALYFMYGKSDDEMEALAEFYIRDFKRFDPEKGPFVNFVRSLIGKRAKNIAWEQYDVKYGTKTDTDPETGKEIKHRGYEFMTVTDSAENEEGDEISAIDSAQNAAVRNNNEVRTMEQKVLQDEWQSEAILQLMQSISRLFASYTKKNNETRHQYYLQFFTEFVSYMLRNVSDSESLIAGISRKRELLDTLKERFLDFTLVDCCRTLPEISESHLKPYGQIVPGRPVDAPPKEDDAGELPGDVHVTYRKKIEQLPATASTVSENRKAYNELFKETLKKAYVS